MKTDFKIDVNIWKILYFRYKGFGIPIMIIFLCAVVLFSYILPGIQNWSQIKDQIAASKSQIEIMTQNFSTLSTFDNAMLAQDVALSEKALPSTKNFSGVLQAISNGSAKSNVALGDYGVEVGDISDKEKPLSTPLSIPITLSIKGSLADLFRFIDALKQELPLSDVTTINSSGENAVAVTIVFYYAPYQQPVVDTTKPIQNFSASENDILEHLATFDTTTGNQPFVSSTPTPIPTIIQFPSGPERVNLGTSSANASGSGQ